MATDTSKGGDEGGVPSVAAYALSKRFGDRDVLRGVSFRIGGGEVFGYLGPNGAGKTTTLRLLVGLLKPTSGSALIDGQDAGRSADTRRRIGVLLEHHGLFDRLSAVDSLTYYAQLYEVPHAKDRVAEMVDLAGLSGRQRDKVGTYSQGMKRRLGLARALLHRPSVLLLDEPSAGLDPEAQKIVRELIVSLSANERITVFMNTHDLDDVQRICTRVAILHEGRIRADETLATWRSRAEASGLVLAFLREDEALRARTLLEERLEISRIEPERLSLTIWTEHELATETAIDLLRDEGISLHEIRRATESLEDLYLQTVRKAGEHA